MQYDTQTANSTLSRYGDTTDAAVRVPAVLAESQGLSEAIEYPREARRGT
jgi:hypothetical protein